MGSGGVQGSEVDELAGSRESSSQMSPFVRVTGRKDSKDMGLVGISCEGHRNLDFHFLS